MTEETIKFHEFEEIYQELVDKNFSYSLSNLVAYFPSLGGADLYLFLMYAIAREESVDKHIAICENLIYMGPQIYGAYEMVKWHITRAIGIFPEDIKAMSWAIEMFYGNPNSPFNEAQLLEYAMSVYRKSKVNPYINLIVEKHQNNYTPEDKV